MVESSNILLRDALKSLLELIKTNCDDNWIVVKNNYVEKENVIYNINNQFKYDMVIKPDSHNFPEIFICLDGNCAMQIGSDIFEIKKGFIAVIPPNLPHTELPKKRCGYRGVWIVGHQHATTLHLSGKNIDGFYIVDGCSFDSNHTYIISDLVNSICNEAKNNYILNRDLMDTYLLQILIYSARYIENFENNDWKDSIIEQIKKYIHKNYKKQIRLSDLSNVICISSNYLNTLFKLSTGKTIIQYHEELRIDIAVNRLKDTSHSIKEIAFELGYYDQYHFSKKFKKRMKVSPSDFRKRLYQM